MPRKPPAPNDFASVFAQLFSRRATGRRRSDVAPPNALVWIRPDATPRRAVILRRGSPPEVRLGACEQLVEVQIVESAASHEAVAVPHEVPAAQLQCLTTSGHC